MILHLRSAQARSGPTYITPSPMQVIFAAAVGAMELAEPNIPSLYSLRAQLLGRRINAVLMDHRTRAALTGRRILATLEERS